jgi:hypothetical protein
MLHPPVRPGGGSQRLAIEAFLRQGRCHPSTPVGNRASRRNGAACEQIFRRGISAGLKPPIPREILTAGYRDCAADSLRGMKPQTRQSVIVKLRTITYNAPNFDA